MVGVLFPSALIQVVRIALISAFYGLATAITDESKCLGHLLLAIIGRFWLCFSRKCRLLESPSSLDVRSAAACPQIIQVHLAFDFFLERYGFLPIDLGFLTKHDCPYERIGAVRRLDTAGSKVGL